MLTDKLKRLEENLKILDSFKEKYTIDNILTDKIDEWGLRYGFFESIQIIIDLACSIVAEMNLGMPKNYSECITMLISSKYLNEELGKKITKMVGLRNLIVHEYGIVDVKKLFEYLNYIDDMRDFVNAIKDIIPK